MQDEINLNGVVYIRKDLGSEPKLLPFDIDKAKAGAEVVTRGGNTVVIYEYNFKPLCINNIAGKVIYGEIYGEDEAFYAWNNEGREYSSSESDSDLFLLNPKGQ